MNYDPKYKLRHRPPQIARLLRYKSLPPPMVGDPVGMGCGWEKIMWAKYAILMAQKRGEPLPLPRHTMRGLWMWECRI